MGGEQHADAVSGHGRANQAIAGGAGGFLHAGLGLGAVPAQAGGGKAELRGGGQHHGDFGSGFGAQAMIDGIDMKARRRGQAGGPALGQHHQRQTIGAA